MTNQAGCTTIELEIPIEATRKTVWNALFDEINDWWLDDFRITGPDSKVTFDRSPGGRGMFEESPDSSFLFWFNVQMYLPNNFQVYLVGHIAPDFGGPTTSNLKLAFDETDSGCVLKLTDARHGRIDESQQSAYKDGWRVLFTDGLKAYVESK